MRACWLAPHRPEWESWAWPLPTDFGAFAGDYTVAYPNPNAETVMGAEAKDKWPSLRLVVTPSTGETHLDREGLEGRGVAVLSLLDDREALENIRASSEFTFLLVLNALRRMDRALLSGGWERSDDAVRGRELHQKMVGLIGHGRIGKQMDAWLSAFGAGVYWNDPADKGCIFQAAVEWMFRNCHVVVVCCSLTAETRKMVTGNLVRLMRPGAILVNTARGEILDEDGVAAALVSRPDLDLWTDVLSGEATGEIATSPLLGLPNAHITPHMAGTTFESQEKAARIALSLSYRWLNGHP